MNVEELVKAFWGRLDIRLTVYGYHSLRNFCEREGLNYQVVVAARRKLRFPYIEDLIVMTEKLNISTDELIFGRAVNEAKDRRERNSIENRKFQEIFEYIKRTDPIRLAAIKIILGLEIPENDPDLKF